MAKQLVKVILDATDDSVYWTLWAPNDIATTIGLIDGVNMVSPTGKNCYSVFVDPRYDLEQLKREILALGEHQESTEPKA